MQDGTLVRVFAMLDCQKHYFSLPADVHYLNCAYMSPLLAAAETAGIEGLRRKRMPGAIAAEDFFSEADLARSLFARLVNAPDAARIAIVPAASYAIAAAARNTPVSRGQNVVVAHEQFPSNVYAWRRLCARTGAALRTIAPPEGAEQRGEVWNERLMDAIDASTAIVALAPVHWTDGTRFDLERIGARARDCGATLIVDGTQAVGALPFDVERIQPDLLVCAAYKWLLGPYTVGFAYFGSRYDDGEPLEDTWLSRVGSDDFRGLVHYNDAQRPGAARYDAGEASNFALLPAAIAGLEQLLDWGPERIQDYCRKLTRELIADAATLGFTVEDDAWRAAHLFGLRAPAGVDTTRVQEALHARNVFVSLRGSAIRVSPHVYNDAADVAALREALGAVV